MIVVVDVIMLWPVVTRESGRGQRELRELSSRADWYDYHHHFPELRIQSPKSPKDNHLYLGQKINVVCTLINFVLVYVGCLWHVGFHLMLKGESPRNIAWSNIWPSLWSSLIDTSWIESLTTSRTLTSLSIHVTIKVNEEWRRQIPALKNLVIWDVQRAIHFTQLHRDGAHHSQGREQMHSVLERLTPSLRQMKYQNFMRTLILFFSVHNLWTIEKM